MFSNEARIIGLRKERRGAASGILPRQPDAVGVGVGVGVIQQAAMVRLWNQSAVPPRDFSCCQRYGADKAVPAIPATLASPPSFLMMAVAGSMPPISDIPKLKSSPISENRNCFLF
jgi:hypothetical protein